MQEYFSLIQDHLKSFAYLSPLMNSFIVLALFFVAKKLLISNIEGKKIARTQKSYLVKRVHVYSRFIIVLIIFLLWFSQLQGVFVSLLAVAAALVLAFKELIMCVTGGILIRSANIFKLADRIEIGKIRGFVVERGLFASKVLEIGPEKSSQQTTGNIITFSNSMIFGNVLKNESYFRGHSIKSYSFLVENRHDIDKLEKFILEEALALCSSYLEEAKKNIGRFCEKEGIAIPSIAPRIKVIIGPDEKNGRNTVKLLLKMPVKNSEIGHVEQTLNRRYLDFLVQNYS